MNKRFLALFKKTKLDHELDGEVQAYLELAERDLIANGVAPEEARAQARRDFGGVEQMKEQHRDDRSYPLLENMARDFRYGLSALASHPGFAAVTIGVLALGIGASTAMFSLIDALLWKPLPFPQPDRIVRVDEASEKASRNHATTTLTFLDWKRQDSVFEAISVDVPTTATLTTSGEPTRLSGKLVSSDYFNVFSVHAQLGRTFVAGEDQPGATPVVVISHALWQTRFAGDAAILHRVLVLDGESSLIVGVLPAGAFDRDVACYWKPLIFAPEQMTRGAHWLEVVARLRDGVSMDQARAKLTALRASLAKEMPPFKKNWTFVIEPFTQELVGDKLRQSVCLGFGAVVMVLLIACANVANLLLAKGATRQKELALRAALGASRGRLTMQLLVESWVLCIVGGACGVALAYLMLDAAAPMLAPYLPFTADLNIDPRVLGFAAAAAMAVSILVGILPSLQASSTDLAHSLNQSSRGSTGSSAFLRRTIVIGEVAVSLVLLCGASLLFRSLENLQKIDPGVRIDHVITMSADLLLAQYPKADDATQFYRTAVDRLESVPGVERASISQDLPLQGVRGGELFYLPGVNEPLVVRFKRVDPEYFSTLDIPVVAGRGIEANDRAKAPFVVVINQELAKRIAGAYSIANPLGTAVRVSSPGYGKDEGGRTTMQIIGVIRNERTSDLNSPTDLVIYVPLAQFPRTDVKLIVSTKSDPTNVMSGIREAIRQIDPKLALGDVSTMEEVKQHSLTWAKQPTWAIGAFAAVAALLTALGLYGVLSHAVTQQRREIGIRIALGASPRDILSRILGNALALIGIGLVLGIAGAVALTRAIKSLLYGVSPLDPIALTAACVAMILIGLGASYIPSRRAASVNPVNTLRGE